MIRKTKNISNIKIILLIKKQYCIKHALSKVINVNKPLAGMLFLTNQKNILNKLFNKKR